MKPMYSQIHIYLRYEKFVLQIRKFCSLNNTLCVYIYTHTRTRARVCVHIYEFKVYNYSTSSTNLIIIINEEKNDS